MVGEYKSTHDEHRNLSYAFKVVITAGAFRHAELSRRSSRAHRVYRRHRGEGSLERGVHPDGAARSIVVAPAPQRGDMDFSAYRVSRRVHKCTAPQIDGDHCMRSRFVSAENHYPVVPSNDLVP